MSTQIFLLQLWVELQLYFLDWEFAKNLMQILTARHFIIIFCLKFCLIASFPYKWNRLGDTRLIKKYMACFIIFKQLQHSLTLSPSFKYPYIKV